MAAGSDVFLTLSLTLRTDTQGVSTTLDRGQRGSGSQSTMKQTHCWHTDSLPGKWLSDKWTGMSAGVPPLFASLSTPSSQSHTLDSDELGKQPKTWVAVKVPNTIMKPPTEPQLCFSFTQVRKLSERMKQPQLTSSVHLELLQIFRNEFTELHVKVFLSY